MKYLNSILVLLLLASSGLAIKYYFDLKECRSLPDFRPSLAHVSKYIGAERDFLFYLECKGGKLPEDCKKKDMSDITGKVPPDISPERRGTIWRHRFALKWIEKVIFHVDLSDPKIWDIDYTNKKAKVTLPAVQFDRILNNKKFVPYVIDRSLWKDDENWLLKLVKSSHKFSESKTKEYLSQNRQQINSEVQRSVKKFVKSIIKKMGYSSDFEIEVEFNKQNKRII